MYRIIHGNKTNNLRKGRNRDITESGCFSKLEEKTRWAANRQTATLTELQEFEMRTFYVIIISCNLDYEERTLFLSN